MRVGLRHCSLGGRLAVPARTLAMPPTRTLTRLTVRTPTLNPHEAELALPHLPRWARGQRAALPATASATTTMPHLPPTCHALITRPPHHHPPLTTYPRRRRRRRRRLQRPGGLVGAAAKKPVSPLPTMIPKRSFISMPTGEAAYVIGGLMAANGVGQGSPTGTSRPPFRLTH